MKNGLEHLGQVKRWRRTFAIPQKMSQPNITGMTGPEV
jgi:hypothetical protein